MFERLGPPSTSCVLWLTSSMTSKFIFKLRWKQECVCVCVCVCVCCVNKCRTSAVALWWWSINVYQCKVGLYKMGLKADQEMLQKNCLSSTTQVLSSPNSHKHTWSMAIIMSTTRHGHLQESFLLLSLKWCFWSNAVQCSACECVCAWWRLCVGSSHQHCPAPGFLYVLLLLL